MKSKRVILGFTVLFLSIIFIKFSSAALGISPAINEIDFKPFDKVSYNFQVSSDRPGTTIGLSVSDALKPYSILEKENITKSEIVNLKINFPESFNKDKPGMNRYYFCAEELMSDDELQSEMFALKTVVCALIRINTPYEGEYVEIFNFGFNPNPANIGDLLDMSIGVVSRGTETVTVNPKVNIYSGEKIIDSIELKSRTLETHEKVQLRKQIDTSKYAPGTYRAELVVSYGDKNVTSSSELQLGKLLVKITDYTNYVVIDQIKKFEITAKSNWNNGINTLYANVSIRNDSGEMLNFLTTPINLNPWEKQTMMGYFDSSKIKEGTYPGIINLIYMGNSSSQDIQVEFVSKSSFVIPILIVLVISIFLIVIAYLVKKKLSKKKKSKHGKKK